MTLGMSCTHWCWRSQLSTITTTRKGDDRIQSYSITPLQEWLNLCIMCCSKNTEEMRKWKTEYTCCPIWLCTIESQQRLSTLMKEECRQNVQLQLEGVVCFCDQAMQEPYYRFGLNWMIGQPHIQTLPIELSIRILEACSSTFQSLLICNSVTFTARHYIFIQTQNTHFQELFMSELNLDLHL